MHYERQREVREELPSRVSEPALQSWSCSHLGKKIGAKTVALSASLSPLPMLAAKLGG